MTKNKICIVIPAYNEEKRIGKTIREYCSFFKSKKRQEELDFEIIVVINNTTDKTEEIVKSFQKSCKELKLLNFKQGGKGFAIIEGFKEALNDKNNSLIGFVDADMATTPEEYYKLIRAIDGWDGVIASRYVSGAVVKTHVNFRRKIVARAFNLIVRLLFALRFKDTQCGAKIFNRKAVLEYVGKARLSEWAFDVELLYVLTKKGFQIKENPTVWTEISGGSLKVIRTSVQMLLSLLQLRIKYSRFSKMLSPFERIIGIVFMVVR